MVDAVPDNATALTITQDDVNDLDRAAVTRFHNIQIKRIMAGDRTLGDNRDTIEQAFARHRIETEQRLLPTAPGAVRIYVRWSNDGQHIRHWSREPFKHGLNQAQPVDAATSEVGHCCPARPIEARDIGAVLHNLVGQLERGGSVLDTRSLRKLADAKAALARWEPIRDAHFAALSRGAAGER